MKYLKFFLPAFFLLPIAALADSTPPVLQPEEMCTVGPCTENMKAILEQFKNAENIGFADLAGFSGTCYHIHPNLNPEHPHHGLVRLREESDGFKFSGLFSFFTKENPYSEFSVTDVDDYFNKREAKRHPVSAEETHYTVRVGHPDYPPNHYWLKITENAAYLISKWQYEDPRVDVRIFCELDIVH